MTSRTLTQMFLTLAALAMLAMSALAGDPGMADPGTLSDQRAGSILIYNYYSSSSTNPTAENARIAITNTNDTQSALVHLFFVDGATCSVADSFICLTKSQTTTLLASDVDPDVRGYIVAIVVDKNGAPLTGFNYLIGDEYIKLASGHAANLGAEAITGVTATADMTEMTATLKFKAPRVVAIDNIPSAKDGNDTLLILNRLSDVNLVTGNTGSVSIFGLLFDELENSYSYTFSLGCQIRQSLSDSFPRTSPRFTSVIPAGTSGWTKFWSTTATAGLLGATINKNTTPSASSFNGGHNLHKLTYTEVSVKIPVFPAMGC